MRACLLKGVSKSAITHPPKQRTFSWLNNRALDLLAALPDGVKSRPCELLEGKAWQKKHYHREIRFALVPSSSWNSITLVL